MPSATATFTHQQISAVIGCPLNNVNTYWPFIQQELAKRDLNDRWTVIAVLATIGVETASFAPISEYGGDVYFTKMYDIKGEHPKTALSLGNINPGDGKLFHGRGFIQLTGRHNYAVYGKELGIDLESHPELALNPGTAAALLAAFVKHCGLSIWANKAGKAEDDAQAELAWQHCRRTVNGGLNGYEKFKTLVYKFAAL
jgi:predicted chitinase